MATEIIVSAKALDDFDWDRQAVGQHLGALVTGTTGAQVRGGVVPANGNPLGYAQKTGLVGTLRAGRYILPVSDASLGPLVLWLPANDDLTHDTANGTNPRTDLIIAEVIDTGDDATSKVHFRIVKGRTDIAGAPVPTTNWATPNGSAVDLGNGGWAEIARVTINASGGAGAINAVVDKRTYASAAGGSTTLSGSATTPANAASLPPGAPVWDDTNRRIMFRDGGSGLVHPIPLGVQSNVSVYTGAAAIAADTLGFWADGGSPLTFQSDQSYGPQIATAATSADLELPAGVFAVWAQIFGANGAVAGQYCKIVRSMDQFALAAENFVGATAVMNNPAVYAATFGTITGRIYNPAGATRTYTTYLVIARVGSIL